MAQVGPSAPYYTELLANNTTDVGLVPVGRLAHLAAGRARDERDKMLKTSAGLTALVRVSTASEIV